MPADVEPRHPVFVVGSPRSGTSAMVDTLLAAGYRGFREGNFLPLAYKICADIDRHFSVFAIGTDRILIGCVDREVIKRKIYDLFQSIVNNLNTNQLWFDKTGGAEMIRFLPVILELWPNAAIIMMTRRGLENISSRLKKFPNITFRHHCLDWGSTMAAWRDVRSILPHHAIIEIDQRNLIQYPQEVSSSLRRFLGLSADQEADMARMLLATRPQETEPGSSARTLTFETTGWTAEQKELFLQHCSIEMSAFGYTLDKEYRHLEHVWTAPAAQGEFGCRFVSPSGA